MPSRQLSISPPSMVVVDPYPQPPPPPPIQPHLHQNQHLFSPPLLASSACSLFVLLLLCFRRNTKKRTAPSSDSDSNPPHRFSYSVLRRATNSFSTLLGHGGFGPVFSGALPPTGKPVAVKLMDSASLQGEREFHNELFFASRLRSQHVVPPFGFSSDEKRRRFLLVYELMDNGNLQDALLRRKCPELMDWKKRFAIVTDIARGIQYLHSCDPPVIHGDIKPSNILLDRYLSAKIGDFGLARLKSESRHEAAILGVDAVENKRKEEIDDGGSLTESVNTQSPEGFVRIPISETSPETTEMAEASPMEVNLDKASSIQSNQEDIVGGVKKNDKGEGPNSNNSVRDYVMEWIGKGMKNETPKSETRTATAMGRPEKKKSKKKQLEWWESMDEEEDANFANRVLKKDQKRRPGREWWKEEYSEELAKKKKKKKKQQKKKGENSDDNGDENDWWVRDDALYGNTKKTKNRSRNSRGSLDWWLDGFSGELRRARRSSSDSAGSGEIPKSGGISSTPSMRGTVFYVAPEHGYSGDNVSEKCDVYSFGMLLLVIISGRRPLQVSGSPLSEFKRANLLSWARHCACNGKLLEVVDESIQKLDIEQALLCITVALLCLLKSPSRRPSMKEVVGMLSGELEPPQLPVEYSLPFKSRKEGR